MITWIYDYLNILKQLLKHAIFKPQSLDSSDYSDKLKKTN